MHATERIVSARRSVEAAVAFALCLAGALLLRLPAFGMPLDRDAAVYAVIGRGLRDGQLPYSDLIDHKQPLVYPVYSLLDLVAPGSFAAPRVASALISAAAAVILFALLRPRVGLTRAALAAAFVVLLGASRFVQGFDLNTEHLLLLTGTLPIAVALAWPRAAFAVGVLYGLAILTKAVAVLLIPAALIPLLLAGGRGGMLLRFVAGVALPLALVAVFYAANGALDDLWAWNVGYNLDYAGELSAGDRVERLRGHGAVLLLVAASAVAALVCLRARGWRDPLALTLSVWLAGAVLGALAGGYAYAHYFVPVIVPAAGLIAVALPFEQPLAAVGLFTIGALAVLVTNHVGGSLASRTYGGNVAVWEANEPVGRTIRERARPGDRMFVAGSEAGFYWQARVTPATRLLYDSPLAFRPELQAEVEDAPCSRPPRFLVLPQGTYPAYARCLEQAGYAALDAPPPIAVLERR